MSGKWFVEGQRHIPFSNGRYEPLLKTWHTSKGSAQIEVSAWIARMKRGEVDKIFIIAPDGEPSRVITRANLHEVTRDWGGDASPSTRPIETQSD